MTLITNMTLITMHVYTQSSDLFVLILVAIKGHWYLLVHWAYGALKLETKILYFILYTSS